MDISLSSAGSLCVAVLAGFFFICQAWLFLWKRELLWNAWGAGLSFCIALYSFVGFVQYNTPPGDLNRLCELVQYSCLIGLLHCVHGFSLSYLALPSRRFHRVALPLHGLILLLLWFTPLFVAQGFIFREFLWLNRPYVEPLQGPWGGLLVLYVAVGSFAALTYWIRHARYGDNIPFFVGIAFWAVLGIHDALATLGMPTVQFLMQYGFLAFAASVLSLTARTYVRVYEAADRNAVEARRERDRLDATLRSMADGFIALDGRGAVSRINEAAVRILGRDGAASVGLPLTELLAKVDSEGRRRLAGLLPEVLQQGTAGSTVESFSIDGPAGETIHLSETHAPIRDGEGAIVGIVLVLRDVTELKELELKLSQASKLEAIGTLAGGVAHDFNNLLMGIQGHASLMLLNLDPSNPHYNGLKGIEAQVKSAADLTRQLLGFARGGRYQIRPTDLNDLIERTATLFGRTRKEIAIQRTLQPGLWTVQADQGQIEQVLMNLYINALQAMPGGGELHLETANVELDEPQARARNVRPGRYVRVILTDTGAGMDEKTMARIFDPFFTTKKMGRGTGLGLAMVYGIVRGHEGLIEVKSRPGQGTSFTIELPAADQAANSGKPENEAILRGSETILLVDDEVTVLTVSRSLLETLGYRVYAAGSGQEALAVFLEKRGEIDLVILDMIMPGLSGSETFDRLRAVDPGLKVLLASGYSVEGEAQKILDRGCNGFIQKPFQLGSLSRRLQEILAAGVSGGGESRIAGGTGTAR